MVCIFCSFPIGALINKDQPLQRAIAVLIDNSHLQIYLHSGESFYINLPYPMSDMLALSVGLLFKRNSKSKVAAAMDINKCLKSTDFDTNFKNLIEFKLNDINMSGTIDNNFNTSYFSLTNPSATLLPVPLVYRLIAINF